MRLFRKLFFIGVVLTITGIIVIRSHWIFGKWLVGEARCVGLPLRCRIYVDGKLMNNVVLYHVHKYFDVREKADYFIIIFPRSDEKQYRNIFFLDRMHNLAGIPVGTSVDDYYSVLNLLFQSRTGAHYAVFQDDMKGYNFDPKLRFDKNTITFKMPAREDVYKCDSVRIEL